MRPLPGRLLAAGLAVALVLGGLLAAVLTAGDRSRPAARSASPSTTASGRACAATRGQPSRGTGPVAADAPSRIRLGPAGEVRRTAETLAAGRSGQRLLVSGTVYAADGATPLAGASLEVWQTNAAGEYGPGHGTLEDHCCYLAGALRTDQRGRYQFQTVKPGRYKGEARPPPAHIHLEVRHPDAAGLLTELLFAGDPALGPAQLGEVVEPEPVAGSDPPTLRVHFDIVLPRR